jgi:hypothetical protein
MVTTVVEVTPFIMKNAIVAFGDNDFAKAVSEATLTPAGGTTDFKGLKPSAVYSFAQSATWSLNLTFAQDWSLDTSLSRYLFDHQGENIPFTLNADDKTEGSTSWAGTVSITAGAVGGAVDAVAVATVTLGVVGAPVPTLVPIVPLGDATDDEPEAA